MSKKLNPEFIQSQYKKHSLILLEEYKGRQTKHLTKCWCGQDFYSYPFNVMKDVTTRCGNHRQNVLQAQKKIGLKIGKLTIVGKEYGKRGYQVVCSCDPNRIYNMDYGKIINSKNPMCVQCYNNHLSHKYGDNLIGETNGKLTVLSLSPEKDNIGLKLICSCQCGNQYVCHAIHWRQKRIFSCGNCGIYRNGVATSYLALQIDEIISKKYKTIHNYNIIKKFNIDIFIQDYKIVVEIDNVFWHKDPIKDKIKHKKILDLYYKLLVISNKNNIPTKQEIFEAIDTLIHTDLNYVEILCK